VKKPLSFLSLSLLLSVICSCSKNDPVACFVVPESVEINEQYVYKDCSVNAGEYFWDFGDGETSELKSPAHTYLKEGNFTISLKVKNKDNKDELKRTISTFLNDLTASSGGIYTGNYIEQYPDSSLLNKFYAGSVSVSPTGPKDIKVALVRGSFEANVIGDMNTGYAFTHVTKLQPARLQMMTSGSGSYSESGNTFTFKLSGKDPQTASLNWVITFTGVKN
jgi:PKD repeat protein